MTERPGELSGTDGPELRGALNLAVARNLRRLRKEMGLSQDGFERHTGLHRTYASAIERGQKNLTLRSVERLATKLGVDPLDLLR